MNKKIEFKFDDKSKNKLESFDKKDYEEIKIKKPDGSEQIIIIPNLQAGHNEQ